jgi:hypothetical protein
MRIGSRIPGTPFWVSGNIGGRRQTRSPGAPGSGGGRGRARTILMIVAGLVLVLIVVGLVNGSPKAKSPANVVNFVAPSTVATAPTIPTVTQPPTTLTVAPTTVAPMTVAPTTTSVTAAPTTVAVAPPVTTAQTIAPAVTTAPALATPAGDGSYTNSNGNVIPDPVQSPSGPPAGATAHCKDGSYSFSQHHSGTCSGHGGVAAWL